jgi:flagellar motility protein MotE (MotC chaperone)
MRFPTASGSNILITLSVLFAVGGAARFLPATGIADAQDAPRPAKEADHLPVLDPAGLPPVQEGSVSSLASGGCVSPDLVVQMEAEWAAIADRQRALGEKEAALATLGADLSQQSAELEALEAFIEDRWTQLQAGAQEDLTHLAQMYAAMKPDQAARIFEETDPAFTAGLMRMMPGERAGLVMAAMSPARAYEVTVILAQRNGDLREASDPG